MIFLLERLEYVHYDETESMVVRAHNEKAARRVASTGKLPRSKVLANNNDAPGVNHAAAQDEGPDVWLDPEKTSCTRILATEDEAVICVNVRWG